MISAKKMKQETERYFDRCRESGEIPDVEALAGALGLVRRELLRMRLGAFGRLRTQVAEQALTRIAAEKKQLFMRGKIPAGVFTFDFKNNHDYADKPEEPEAAPEPPEYSLSRLSESELLTLRELLLRASREEEDRGKTE